MNEIRVGLIGESSMLVTEDKTALEMGSGSLEVLATPAMIAVMEAACVSAVDAFLESENASVGIELNVRHLSATPVGETVVAMAEVTEVSGRRIVFEVRAWDENEMIGDGTHVRYIINRTQFEERLQDSTSSSAVETLKVPDHAPVEEAAEEDAAPDEG